MEKNEKNEKFEYFEDLFHTTLRMQPNLTEDMKINQSHVHLRRLALKTLKNILRTPNLRRHTQSLQTKICETGIQSISKHRFNRLSFDPGNQKLPDCLEELQESAGKAFDDNARQMIENLLYAKMPPHLKKSINQAYLEKGTYEQIVKHLEREMELNGLGADEHLKAQMTVTKNDKTPKNPTKNKTRKPKNKLQKQYTIKHSKMIKAVIEGMPAT